MGTTERDRGRINKMIRVAVVMAVIGLLCVFAVLWRGFAPWSMGVGMFIGMPLIITAIIIYLFAVIRDMKDHGLL